MHRSPVDVIINKESRHFGQRSWLIPNPCFSTAYWIPGQARYDGFYLTGLFNGTAKKYISLRSLRLCASALKKHAKKDRTMSGLFILFVSMNRTHPVSGIVLVYSGTTTSVL
jgi:hypothetical protein